MGESLNENLYSSTKRGVERKLRLRSGIIIRLMIILMFLVSLYSHSITSSSEDLCEYYQLYIPAVSDRGEGEVVRVLIYVLRGSSGFYVVGLSSISQDTLISMILSLILSSVIAYDNFYKEHAIYIVFPREITMARGPSAGALLTYSLIRIGLSRGINSSISGTGAINLDGSIEIVGSVRSKLDALASVGSLKIVFVPFSSYVYERLSSSYKGLIVIPTTNILDLFYYSGDLPGDVSVEIRKRISDLLYSVGSIVEFGESQQESIDLMFKAYERAIERAYERAIELSATLNITLDHDLQIMRDILKNYPDDKDYFYLRTNILYLLTAALYQKELTVAYYTRRDLYESLYNEFVESINQSFSFSREIFYELSEKDLYSSRELVLLINLLDRLFDLVNIYNKNNHFSPQSSYSIPDLALAYLRSISIRFWLDLFNYYRARDFSNTSYYNDSLNLSLIYSRISKMIRLFNVSHEEIDYTLRKTIDTLKLSDLSYDKRNLLTTLFSILVLFRVLDEYSFNLKYSTTLGVAESLNNVEVYRYYSSYINYTLSLISNLTRREDWDLSKSMYLYTIITLSNISLINTTLYVSAIRVLSSLLSQSLLISLVYGLVDIPEIVFVQSVPIYSLCLKNRSETLSQTRSANEYYYSETSYAILKRVVAILIIIVSLTLLLCFYRSIRRVRLYEVV